LGNPKSHFYFSAVLSIYFRLFTLRQNRAAVGDSWWFSIDRRDADKQLMLPGNPRGTFLIRNSGGASMHHIPACVNVARLYSVAETVQSDAIQCE